MIIDAFIFYNELDLLEMRLIELDPVVDKFLIVQAYHTFRAVPKPVFFQKNDERWAKYRDKISTVTIGLSGGKDTWEREAYQRNIISIEAKHVYAPEDILIISDADEIPRREAVRDLGELDAPVAFGMRHYNYGLNCRFPGIWGAAKALRVRDLTTAEEIRHLDILPIEDAGWHFSYFGDDEFISNKFRSFSHSEVDTPLVHSRIAENRMLALDPHNHGQQLTVETIDPAQWPHAVQDNPEYWSKYVW